MKRLLAAMPAVVVFLVLPAIAPRFAPGGAVRAQTPPHPVVGRVAAGMFLRVSAGVSVSAPGAAPHVARSLEQFYVGEEVRVPATPATGHATELVLFAGGERLRLPAGSVIRVKSPRLLAAMNAFKPVRLRPLPGRLMTAFVPAPGQPPFGPNPGGMVKRPYSRSALLCAFPGALRSLDADFVLRWKDTKRKRPADTPPPIVTVWEGGDGKPPASPEADPETPPLFSVTVATTTPDGDYIVKSALLQPGKWYCWRVSVGERKAYGTFRVMASAERSGINTMEAQFRDLEAHSDPDELAGVKLLAASFYTRHDLYTDALHAFEAVRPLEPDDATAAERIELLKELLLEPEGTASP